MILEICLLVLMLFIIIIYLFFNRSTLIPVQSHTYSQINPDNELKIPVTKGV